MKGRKQTFMPARNRQHADISSDYGRIYTQGLTYIYPGDEEPALKNIDITFDRGVFYAVIGRNGSGKSTLAKCLNALLMPTCGKVIACGFDTSIPENHREIRKRISIVFQNPQTQIIGTTVEEDVAFGPENLCLEPQEIKRRVKDALALAGISELSGNNPHNLSMGEKQLVAIAGALAMKPHFILSDESTSMLDYPSRKRIITLFDNLREMGVGIIHFTHFLEECLLADRIILLNGGVMVANAKPSSILRNSGFLDSHGIEPLPVSLICDKLISLGCNVPQNIITAEELMTWFAL